MPQQGFLRYEGIEFEFEEVRPDNLNLRNKKISWDYHNDASVEGHRLYNNGVRVKTGDEINISNVSNRRVGGELVSNLIDLDNIPPEDILDELKMLCGEFVRLGETPESNRSSLHIHLNFAHNLDILKSIIKVGTFMEQVFFSLGGMGYQYRGMVYDSIYSRPITRKGPPCVTNSRGGFSQVFNVDDLLAAKTVDEFQDRYGDIRNQSRNRYPPVRYTYLNLAPLFDRRGSLELRICNKTLNPYYIYAMMELFKSFGEFVISNGAMCRKRKLELEINSIYENTSRSHIIDTLLYFSSLTGLDERKVGKLSILDVLLEILEKTPPVHLNDEYVFSHLMFHQGGNRTSPHFSGKYNPVTIPEKQIKRPFFEDIHNIENGRRNSDVNRARTQNPFADISERLEEVRANIHHEENMIDDEEINVNRTGRISGRAAGEWGTTEIFIDPETGALTTRRG